MLYIFTELTHPFVKIYANISLLGLFSIIDKFTFVSYFVIVEIRLILF